MTLMPGKKAADHYASFSRRMWAATIDSLIIIMALAPIFELLFNALYGVPEGTLDIATFQQQMAEQTDTRQAWQVFWQGFHETGLYDRWVANTTFQTVVLCVLTALCWHKWSSTPGKMLLRLRIVDAESEMPISDRQIVLRILGYFVSTLPLFAGFFWISLDKRRQGWHDKIAGTVVILQPKKAGTTPGSAAADR